MELKSKVENGSVRVDFVIKDETWEKALKQARTKLTENLEIKGFRKGKVPVEIATKHINDDKVRSKAVNLVIDANWENVYKEVTKENIITKPMLNVEKVTDKELSGFFIAELYPEIKLGDTTKINVELSHEKISDEELQSQLEQLKQFYIGTEVVKGKKIAKGDIANIDFIGKHNGKEFEGGKGEKFDLKIGSKSFVDNFEDQLIGLQSGDKKEITVTFPKEYPQENLAGEKVQFSVKINEVKTETELTGKDLTAKLKPLGFESKEDLVRKVTIMANDQKQQQNKDKFFREYVDAVAKLKDSNITIPSTLLLQEMDREFKKFETKLTQQKMKMSEYLKMIKSTPEEFKEKNLKPQVEKTIMDGLVYQELIKLNKIKVEDSDYKDEFQKIASSQGMNLAEVEKSIEKEQITNSIIYNKLIKKLNS